MKQLVLFFILGCSLLLTSCQQGDEPQPMSATDSLALQLSGSWQSRLIQKSFYTNDELTNQENSESVETYNFTKEGGFQLVQSEFFIKGKWVLTRTGNKLIVSTDSDEVLEWQVKSLSDTQLVLYSSQTTMVGDTAERLETWIECTRVIP
jgi:hypothetical protein